MDNEDILFFELWNDKDDLVANFGKLEVLPEEFSTKPKDNFTIKGFRNAYRKNEQGSVRFVVSDKNKFFQGTASIQRACIIYLSFIPKLKRIEMAQRQS